MLGCFLTFFQIASDIYCQFSRIFSCSITRAIFVFTDFSPNPIIEEGLAEQQQEIFIIGAL